MLKINKTNEEEKKYCTKIGNLNSYYARGTNEVTETFSN